MTNEEIRVQAEKLAHYVARGGNAARWLCSKDLTPKEQAAILCEVRKGGKR